MKYIKIALLILSLLLACNPAANARPKVGLVLGGGGAAGVAHVGVLKVLEENNIPIDMIAGNSMGAIVGGLYASGMSADELEKTVNTLEWPDLFEDSQPRKEQRFHQKEANSGFFSSFELGLKDGKLKSPSGLVTGQKLMFELRSLFTPVNHIQNFDQLPIPFRAVATDIETGKAIVLKKGNLAQSVRASMAIPGIFSPVKIDGRLLVDGFVSNNVPVDIGRQMGADILIVVNIPTFLEKQAELDSAVSVGLQAMRLMMLKTTQPQLEKMQPQDILIEPGIKDIGNLDFDRVGETIPLGERAAREQLDRLKRLAVKNWSAQRLAGKRTPPGLADGSIRIARIELNNSSNLSDDVLRKRLGVYEGEFFNAAALQRGLENIYGLGEFELVDHHLDKDANGEYILTVNAVPGLEGAKRLRFGFSLSDDFKGGTQYQFGVSRISRGISEQGGEWTNSLIIGDTIRFDSDLYYPIPKKDLFVEPHFWHEQRDFFSYEGDNRLAEVRGRVSGVRLDVGREFDEWGEARAGVFYSYTNPDVTTGQAELADRIRSGGLRFQYRTDTMDEDRIPTEGRRLLVEYTKGLDELGSDHDFDRLRVSSARAWSRGQHRLIFNAEAGTTFTDENLLAESLSLGGFGRMSGLSEHQLAGNHLFSASLAYLYELSDMGGLVQVYGGGTAEAGNVWAKSSEIDADDLLLTGSVFIGADTPLGPAFVGVAQTESYDTRPFLYVGGGF